MAGEKFEFGSNAPEVGRRVQPVKPRTISVKPIPLQPVRVSQTSVAAAAFGAISNQIRNFVNIRQQREFQTEQLAAAQAQQEAVSTARTDLLRLVTDTINEQEAASDSPFDFRPKVASDAGNEAILGFLQGPQGWLINNDTLRFVKSEKNALIAERTSVKQVTLQDGVSTIVEEIDGDVEVTQRVFDKDLRTLNHFAAVNNSMPNAVLKLMNDPDLSEVEREAGLQDLVDDQALIEQAGVASKIDAINNPQQNEIKDVRVARAKAEYATHFDRLERQALVASRVANFDPTKPGAYIAIADSYALNMGRIAMTDKFGLDLSTKYQIDLQSEVADQVQRRNEKMVAHLRSLDALNVKKIGASAAVAEATRTRSELEVVLNNVKSALPLDVLLVSQVGQNLSTFPMYKRMIQRQSGEDPSTQLLMRAMHIGTSMFKDMNARITAVPDDDKPETRQQALTLIRDFGETAKAWAERRVLDAADIRGFVATMQAMRESDVFQRSAPKAFAFLEEIYETAKANGENTATFERLERGEDINDIILESYRSLISR